MRIWMLLPLLVVAAFAAPAQAEGPRLGSLEFEPCTLAAELQAATVDARCTTLEVPENRAAPDGRRIKLAIAWVASEAKQAEPDPVFDQALLDEVNDLDLEWEHLYDLGV